MYAVVYQFKFPSISEAKVAAGFCSEALGGKISEYDFLGLNILISKNGDLNINVKFEDIKWSGIYQLKPYPIYDSAVRMTKGMFVGGDDNMQILSFQIKKCQKVSLQLLFQKK